MLAVMKNTLHPSALMPYMPFIQLGCDSAQLLHEIANPLTTASLSLAKILGISQKNAFPSEIQEAQNAVTQACNTLHTYRNTGSGKKIWFNPEKNIHRQIAVLSKLCSKQQVSIQPFVQNGIRCFGSPKNFDQLLQNLLRNAVEAYGSNTQKNRSVEITLTKSKRVCNVTVTDWGGGISESEMPRIFELFYSTKNTHTGIGLALVKKIVEVDFSGTITCNTANGATTFSVSLPIPAT